MMMSLSTLMTSHELVKLLSECEGLTADVWLNTKAEYRTKALIDYGLLKYYCIHLIVYYTLYITL